MVYPPLFFLASALIIIQYVVCIRARQMCIIRKTLVRKLFVLLAAEIRLLHPMVAFADHGNGWEEV